MLADERARAQVLNAGGEMGALMRARDWAGTPVGPVANWPQSLRTALSILLASGYPMYIAWGPEFVQFYNDAYRPILGSTKHPAALGRSSQQTFAEIWDLIGPMFLDVMRLGQETTRRDQLLPLDRFGYLEECYFDFSYSPIRAESGEVGGVFVTCTETTQRVLGERRLQTLHNLATSTRDAHSATQACVRAAEVLAGNAADLPFGLIYLLSSDGDQARLASLTGLEPGTSASPSRVKLNAGAPWRLQDVVQTGAAILIQDATPSFGPLPGGPWEEPSCSALVLPIPQPGAEKPTGVLVAGISPRRALDQEYRAFLELVAGQIGQAVGDVRAYEAERRRAESLAELDRAKTTFLSNVSHEFRTPLTLLLGPLEDALLEPSLPDHERRQMEVAHRNALRLLRLVNTLLDFSRIEAGRVQATYEPTDLATLTADLASTFRSAMEKAGLELVVDCPPLDRPVYVDRDMWEKIILNLLSNAFKFTLEGSITVAQHQVGDHVDVVVRDTGVGIPPEELGRVFQRFHRVTQPRARTHEGTGIGLALVQELVSLHGGTIHAESVPGEGTAFVINLPTGIDHLPPEQVGHGRLTVPTSLGAAPFVEEALRWLPDQNDAAIAADVLPMLDGSELDVSVEAASTRRARILVADDNADMRSYISRLLADRWAVQTVGDGAAALAAALDDPPDLVVSDVMMPRMDGFELVQALRDTARTRGVPVILLSARAEEDAHVASIQVGAADYLIKPFSARELLARVGARLEIARLQRQASEQAEAERRRLQSLITQAPAAICLLEGPDHVFTLANSEYLQLVGRDESIIGQSLVDALPEVATQPFIGILDGVRASGVPYVGQEAPLYLDRRGNGEPDEIFVNFVYQPITGEDGNVDDIFVHAVDVTDQVRARQRAEQLAADNGRLFAAEHDARATAEAAVRTREEFLSIASHELRNPIAAIKGSAQMLLRALQRGPVPHERMERMARLLDTSADRLVTLTNDLLDVSRLRSGHLPLRPEPLDLLSLVQHGLERTESELETAHTFSISTEGAIPPVHADPSRLEQVLTNLLQNAIKYSPGGGEIRVVLRAEEGGARVSVSDPGIGLPPGYEERIFEPFGRASNASASNLPGMGLGLYISRQILEQHHGRIWATSAGENKGTTIFFWIPAEQPLTASEPSPSL